MNIFPVDNFFIKPSGNCDVCMHVIL